MSSSKSVRVLIVDDHPDTLEWMNLLLEDRGYLVQTALGRRRRRADSR